MRTRVVSHTCLRTPQYYPASTLQLRLPGDAPRTLTQSQCMASPPACRHRCLLQRCASALQAASRTIPYIPRRLFVAHSKTYPKPAWYAHTHLCRQSFSSTVLQSSLGGCSQCCRAWAYPLIDCEELWYSTRGCICTKQFEHSWPCTAAAVPETADPIVDASTFQPAVATVLVQGERAGYAQNGVSRLQRASAYGASGWLIRTALALMFCLAD